MQNDELKNYLESIGYIKLIDRGDYWHSNAVYRNGDNQTALRINKDGSGYYDFVTCERGTLDKLILLTTGTESDQDFKKDFDVLNSAQPIKCEKTWAKTELNNLFPHYSFYTERGISEQTLKFFKSGFVQSGDMNKRYVFPIFNEHQKIHGFSGRDMTDRYKKSGVKWLHSGKKSNWIYPYYMLDDNGFSPCQDAISKTNEIIIVESIGDVLSLWESGFKQVLFIAGLTISSKQAAFITSLGLKRIIIATNNDKEKEINRGKIGAINIFLKLSSFTDIENLTICLPNQKDFGDMSKEEVLVWYEKVSKINKIHIYDYAEEYLLSKQPSNYASYLKKILASKSKIT